MLDVGTTRTRPRTTTSDDPVSIVICQWQHGVLVGHVRAARHKLCTLSLVLRAARPLLDRFGLFRFGPTQRGSSDGLVPVPVIAEHEHPLKVG